MRPATDVDMTTASEMPVALRHEQASDPTLADSVADSLVCGARDTEMGDSSTVLVSIGTAAHLKLLPEAP